MNDADKQHLHRQAYDQAEKFEVLNKRDVSSMSRVSNLRQRHLFVSLLTYSRNYEHLMSAVTTYVEHISLYALVARSFTVA
jgi:hypothetical protein